jgi:transketolase
MKDYDKFVVIVGDLGYGMFDRIREDYPERFFNVGASEQAMVDIAVGMALSGKTPIVYTITPFLVYRPYESIINYIYKEGLRVKLIGSGMDDDYKEDGPSHWFYGYEHVPFIIDEIRTKRDVKRKGYIEGILKDFYPRLILLKR